MNRYSQHFYNSVSNRALQSGEIVADVLSGFITPSSLVDIGSGQGVWLHTISNEFESVTRAVALDLQQHESPFFKELTESSKNFEFIEVNFETDPKLPDENFDIGICLEVLEHLTPKTAVEIAREIGRKCSFVIFSAAILGQGGTSHINERKFSYWMELMCDQGFIPLDVLRPSLGKSKDVPGYYKQNMVFFWHPENSHRNETRFDMEALLRKNCLEIRDIRNLTTKIRFGLVALIPPTVVTTLVKILDRTVRKFTQIK